MTELTPEVASRAENILKSVQKEAAKRDAVSASPVTRKERAEQTADPDARKTRDLIRKGGYISLPSLAKDLVPFVGDLAERHKLEGALDGFVAANHEYRKVEELPPAIIDWIGPPNGQMALPPGAPDHKVALVAAWHRLLRVVNELTKVGIVKPPKPMLGEPTVIELLVDLDETAASSAPSAWD